MLFVALSFYNKIMYDAGRWFGDSEVSEDSAKVG